MATEKTTTEPIFVDSPGAATKVILTLEDGTRYGEGWVSINRRFFPAKSQAEWDSATHRKCDCGAVIRVGSYCEGCNTKKRREKYAALPYREYDGKTMLCCFDDDRFFRDEDEVLEWCADNNMHPDSLMLCTTLPNYLDEFDAGQWQDIFPEDGDGDLPKEVEDAIKAFNEVIKKQAPISYSMANFRTSIKVPEDFKFEEEG